MLQCAPAVDITAAGNFTGLRHVPLAARLWNVHQLPISREGTSVWLSCRSPLYGSKQVHSAAIKGRPSGRPASFQRQAAGSPSSRAIGLPASSE